MMISPSELLAVIEDIKRVATHTASDQWHSNSNDNLEEEEEEEDNPFTPRTYDIDQLHAEDARDKVFVAILKALAIRSNRPSSPKELATCIMKHQFTVLGGATPYATVSSRISQHFKRIFDHSPPRPPILGRVAHERHTRKYFYYVASAAEQQEFMRKVQAGIITQPNNTDMTTKGDQSNCKKKKTRCMVPAIAVESSLSPTPIKCHRTRRAASADASTKPVLTPLSLSSSSVCLRSNSTRPRRTSYDGGSPLPPTTNYNNSPTASHNSSSDNDDNPYARKRYRSVKEMVAHAYPSRRRQSSRRPSTSSQQSLGSSGGGKWRPSSPVSSCSMGDTEEAADRQFVIEEVVTPEFMTLPLEGIFDVSTSASSSPPPSLDMVVAKPSETQPQREEEEQDGGRKLTTTPTEEEKEDATLIITNGKPTELETEEDSFHDLMDAELMSVNELESLWLRSNPPSDRLIALATIPEETIDMGISATIEPSTSSQSDKSISLDSVESTKVLEENNTEASALEPETNNKPQPLSTAAVTETKPSTCASKVILPDPFADIPPTAMVATEMTVSPRIVLTIVETVPVYMTVITTTEPAPEDTQPGKWIVRRHRLLRLVENGYVNASSLLLAGGVASEQERSIVLSLEVGRFKWRRPQSKLYGTWIPLPRARALAATCSLNHRLGPFLNDNLESYFPAPLPTSFIKHLIMPFFNEPSVPNGEMQPQPEKEEEEEEETTKGVMELGLEFQSLVNTATQSQDAVSKRPPPLALPTSNKPAAQQSISRTSTFGSTARDTPSPSIIQSLTSSRSNSHSGGTSGGGSYNKHLVGAAAAAARAILGSDDRGLQTFLQLLSPESPMLGGVSSVIHDAMTVQQRQLKQQQNTSKPEEEEGEEEEGKEKTEPMAVDAKELTEAIKRAVAEQDKEEEEEDLDMSMVIPGATDDDVDMISSSTPPSPPLISRTPPRMRRLSTAPLEITSKDKDKDDEDARRKSNVNGFNARLAQTMEAFGFTGAAKQNLLLRLRAAAAAKSTGRQPMSVAPHLLFRNNEGVNKKRRLKVLASSGGGAEVDDGSGVKKRARVIRVARAKPPGAKPVAPPPAVNKKKRKTKAVDPSAVLRLASAIYNHTLNMANQAKQQQQQKREAVRPPMTPATPRPTPQRPSTPQQRPSPQQRPAQRPPPQQRPPLRHPLQQRPQRPPMRPANGMVRRPVLPPNNNSNNNNNKPLRLPPARPPQRPSVRPPPRQQQQQHK